MTDWPCARTAMLNVEWRFQSRRTNGGASHPVTAGAVRLRPRGGSTVRLEIGGVDVDTAATSGAATLSLTYAISVVAVSQSASPDMADAAGSIPRSWQFTVEADSCPQAAAHNDVVTGEAVSVSARMHAVSCVIAVLHGRGNGDASTWPAGGQVIGEQSR